MSYGSKSTICRMGLFWRFVSSKVMALPVLHAKSFIKSTKFPVNSLGKSALFGSGLLLVAGILGACGGANIFPPIIEGISIPVINQSPVWDWDTLHAEYDSVYRWENLSPINVEFNSNAQVLPSRSVHLDPSFFPGREPIKSIPGVLMLEVFSWSLFPEQLSSFRFVAKADLQKFCFGQFNQRLHSNLGSLELAHFRATNSAMRRLFTSIRTMFNA